MKASELIEILQQHPDAEVSVYWELPEWEIDAIYYGNAGGQEKIVLSADMEHSKSPGRLKLSESKILYEQ